MPAWVSFPPDRLVQDERSLVGRGISKSYGVASDGATVIIENNTEPGLFRLAVVIEDKNWQEGVISLPYLIGSTRLVTEKQVKFFLVGFRSLMGERCQRRINPADNPFDRAVAGWRPVSLMTDTCRFTVDLCDGSSRLL
jgi:hypothetical protein